MGQNEKGSVQAMNEIENHPEMLYRVDDPAKKKIKLEVEDYMIDRVRFLEEEINNQKEEINNLKNELDEDELDWKELKKRVFLGQAVDKKIVERYYQDLSHFSPHWIGPDFLRRFHRRLCHLQLH